MPQNNTGELQRRLPNSDTEHGPGNPVNNGTANAQESTGGLQGSLPMESSLDDDYEKLRDVRRRLAAATFGNPSHLSTDPKESPRRHNNSDVIDKNSESVPQVDDYEPPEPYFEEAEHFLGVADQIKKLGAPNEWLAEKEKQITEGLDALPETEQSVVIAAADYVFRAIQATNEQSAISPGVNEGVVAVLAMLYALNEHAPHRPELPPVQEAPLAGITSSEKPPHESEGVVTPTSFIEGVGGPIRDKKRIPDQHASETESWIRSYIPQEAFEGLLESAATIATLVGPAGVDVRRPLVEQIEKLLAPREFPNQHQMAENIADYLVAGASELFITDGVAVTEPKGSSPNNQARQENRVIEPPNETMDGVAQQEAARAVASSAETTAITQSIIDAGLPREWRAIRGAVENLTDLATELLAELEKIRKFIHETKGSRGEEDLEILAIEHALSVHRSVARGKLTQQIYQSLIQVHRDTADVEITPAANRQMLEAAQRQADALLKRLEAEKGRIADPDGSVFFADAYDKELQRWQKDHPGEKVTPSVEAILKKKVNALAEEVLAETLGPLPLTSPETMTQNSRLQTEKLRHDRRLMRAAVEAKKENQTGGFLSSMDELEVLLETLTAQNYLVSGKEVQHQWNHTDQHYLELLYDLIELHNRYGGRTEFAESDPTLLETPENNRVLTFGRLRGGGETVLLSPRAFRRIQRAINQIENFIPESERQHPVGQIRRDKARAEFATRQQTIRAEIERKRAEKKRAQEAIDQAAALKAAQEKAEQDRIVKVEAERRRVIELVEDLDKPENGDKRQRLRDQIKAANDAAAKSPGKLEIFNAQRNSLIAQFGENYLNDVARGLDEIYRQEGFLNEWQAQLLQNLSGLEFGTSNQEKSNQVNDRDKINDMALSPNEIENVELADANLAARKKMEAVLREIRKTYPKANTVFDLPPDLQKLYRDELKKSPFYSNSPDHILDAKANSYWTETVPYSSERVIDAKITADDTGEKRRATKAGDANRPGIFNRLFGRPLIPK